MIKTVVCYKTRKPVVYNEGTQWEKTCNDFLAYYTSKTISQAQKEVDKINTTKPIKLWNGQPIKWNEIEYFYVSEQEEMCD